MSKRRAADDSDIDGLFQLPLSEFTAARNALAAKLKAAGNAEEAAEVKALSKPPGSAWVVNQLYWGNRNAFDQMVAAGEQLRKAQASQLRGKGGDVRETFDAHRDAVADLTKRAAEFLREAGQSPSPDLMRRITTTLEALAAYGDHSSAPSAGRLTADVSAPGFDALASLVSDGAGSPGTASSRVIPFVSPAKQKAIASKRSPAERQRHEEAERKARAAAAATAVKAAERALDEARKDAARAEAALKKAAARAKETEKEKESLSARYEKVVAAAEEARQEARQVASQAEDAAQAVEDAERALKEARRIEASLTE